MSTAKDSTSKRPLEKDDSDAAKKKETKEIADRTTGTQEHPSKKSKLDENPVEEGKKEETGGERVWEKKEDFTGTRASWFINWLPGLKV